MSWHFKPWSWEVSPKSGSLLRVFHCSLSVLPLPKVLFHVFKDAKPFLLLLFQVCCCHLQALTGAFSQLPPKTPIVPKRLTFPPWAPIKIYYSFPIVLAVIGALALCLVELVGFPSPFHYYWNIGKDGKSENSKPQMYIPWWQHQQHFNETFNLISLTLVIRSIRKIQVKE